MSKPLIHGFNKKLTNRFGSVRFRGSRIFFDSPNKDESKSWVKLERIKVKLTHFFFSLNKHIKDMKRDNHKLKI